jgi:hypothetical protein
LPANILDERKVAKMRPLVVPMFALTLLVAPVRMASTSAGEPATKFEARVLKALEDKDRAAMRSLAAKFRKLSPEARRELPLRVREDSVEFAFRGSFAGDKFNAEMFEYLVSSSEKDYESLLVVPAPELGRVQALQPFFDKRAGEGRRKWWSAQLIWTDGDAPQSIDLGDLLIHLEEKDRRRFLDQLGVISAGLGGTTNVNADSGFLPRKRVPAKLLLTIRIAPED